MELRGFGRVATFDRYDRVARLYPALLCLLPMFAVVALDVPQVWTLLGGLVSLCSACGLTFFLLQVVRYRGRLVERRLGKRVGRARSALLLSHGDAYISTVTKKRYYGYLSRHGIQIPTVDLEATDPVAANDGFLSAVDWLLEHTRKNAKASMLYNENISYGFRRNLLGIKPFALIVVSLSLALNGYLATTASDQSHRIAELILETTIILSAIAWLIVVRLDFVEDASIAFAQRLFAQCESLQVVQRPHKAKTPAVG